MTKKNATRIIAANGIVAALYFALTMASYPIAFGNINFRISEILVLLCFWRPDFIVGITIGCFMSNILSSLGAWDMLFGTLATFFSCVLIAVSPKLFASLIWPIAINAFVVGFELWWLIGESFWPMVGWVAIGEGTVIAIAYILWMFLWRNKGFMKVLEPRRKSEASW